MISTSKCFSICLLSGVTFGIAAYVYWKLRRQEFKEEDDNNGSNGYQITYTLSVSLETNVSQSDSYISASSVLSSSSLVTSSSDISLSEFSDDDNEIKSRKNVVCGVELEDDPYTAHNTPQTFETQMSSPIVIRHMQHKLTPPLVTGQKQNIDFQDINEEQEVPVVLPYSDSLKTYYDLRGEYNRTVKPNSPLTSAYIKK